MPDPAAKEPLRTSDPGGSRTLPGEIPRALPSYSRKELAHLYGVSEKVFRSWCKEEGLDLGSSHLLRPSKVKLVFETMGMPINFPHPTDHKVIPKRKPD